MVCILPFSYIVLSSTCVPGIGALAAAANCNVSVQNLESADAVVFVANLLDLNLASSFLHPSLYTHLQYQSVQQFK